MKWLTAIGALCGAALTVWLLARFGIGNILDLLGQAGWGIAAVMAFHLLQVLFSALGWRAIAGQTRPQPPLLDFVLLRWIREGVNNLLPVAQVGGEFAATRLLRRRGVSLVQATAGTVCDLTMEMLTQILFTISGLLVLLELLGRSRVTDEVAGGIGVALLVGVLFLGGQWFGLAGLIEKGLMKLSGQFGWQGMGEMRGLHRTLTGLYKKPRNVAWATVHQSVSWLLGAVEVCLALHFLHHDRSLAVGLVIESLGQAVKAAGFAVPGALGVSEGGFVLVGGLFGIPPAACIALALIKRMREIVLGLPALGAWQWLDRHWARLPGPGAGHPSVADAERPGPDQRREEGRADAALEYGDAS
ncbi:lysylphosphatidylglycerol synthase domain-containing protein [Rhizosaccharibacter radicis]|uniref:Lysylphosphatidylglycerol synthase domain-containing protein n=1 Tax=Rhizosaccharibacter radicis TaxID=2782605 RepID=A0ABT1W0I0_9PROT|nr:lysylphosphatidylglycerol synthase domain-containing protein [Acetobacteraceae bacterium KSS12]